MNQNLFVLSELGKVMLRLSFKAFACLEIFIRVVDCHYMDSSVNH